MMYIQVQSNYSKIYKLKILGETKMPILMQMYWDGIKPEQYDTFRNDSGFETDTPRGAIFHTAAYDKKGMHIIDLWETEKDFNDFIEKKIVPIANRLGLKEQPQVEIINVHATFVSGIF